MKAFELGEGEIGFLVSYGTMKSVLGTLNTQGRRWWIASDPEDSISTSIVTIGHGHPHCTDRLNTVYFDVPVLAAESASRPEELILCFSGSLISVQDPGFYLQDGRIVQDEVEDFEEFFYPIKEALLARLHDEGSCTPEEPIAKS